MAVDLLSAAVNQGRSRISGVVAALTATQQRMARQEAVAQEFARKTAQANSDLASTSLNTGMILGSASTAPFALNAGMQLAETMSASRETTTRGKSEAEEVSEAVEKAGEKAKEPTTTAKQDEEESILSMIADKLLDSDRFRELFASMEPGSSEPREEPRRADRE